MMLPVLQIVEADNKEEEVIVSEYRLLFLLASLDIKDCQALGVWVYAHGSSYISR